ncbi:MAG: hypothetical protein JO227_21720 [Acetobacteraceae bacterium]|nr:hypothetical protein [Acetobacteraceae bacterium]
MEKADATYEPLRKKWYAEKNGLTQETIGKQLDELVDKRNVEVLQILGGKKPHISEWAIRIEKISVSDLNFGKGSQKYISLTGFFPCSLSVPFKAEPIPVSGAFTDFLAARKVGDVVALTATLLPHDAATNPPQKAIEWSGFQGSSVEEPEYHGIVERLSDYVPPS